MIPPDRLLPWVREGQRISIGSAVVFVAVVPVLIGFLLGATRAGVALYLPWSLGILFWVTSSLGVWACLFAGSSAAAALLRPWSPPLWLVLAAGAVLGSIPGRYFIYGVAASLQDHLLAGRTPQSAPGFEFSLTFLSNYVQGWAGVYLTWIVIGLVFDRWLTLSHSPGAYSASDNPSITVPAAQQPASRKLSVAQPQSRSTRPGRASDILDRLPNQIGRDVVAIEAEDHYVRVHTSSGNSLIFMRFSDAIEQLTDLDGVRVHRSFWVRRCCVSHVEVHGRGFLLTLSNGLRVPVSQAYKEVARQAGIQPRSGQASYSAVVPPQG